MNDMWYADKRDLVKWGTLVHLASRESLQLIVQVPFLRTPSQDCRLRVSREGQPEAVAEVWEFFRNVHAITALGSRIGRRIVVLGDSFCPDNRSAYRGGIAKAIQGFTEPKAVLLDPDTGLARERRATAKHATHEDVQAIWRILNPGDWLVLYQHAPRAKEWQEPARDSFRQACGAQAVVMFTAEQIAVDVALFAAQKALDS